MKIIVGSDSLEVRPVGGRVRVELGDALDRGCGVWVDLSPSQAQDVAAVMSRIATGQREQSEEGEPESRRAGGSKE